ncbi:MAG TPA: hypothetical protein PK875_02505 [Spirochaetota bacterium]|jgi:hypothetical protein|nr:hypothetical protein [Spirochaetota bacterium]HPI13044.1 hypothetical protein [Spirochaetota bacterium]HPO44646.1 hypothetical protein [Spirochaetota bacterium]
MKHIARFKSIPIVKDRRNKTNILTFDLESARNHVLIINMGHLLANRSWISSVSIALMVAIPLAVLAYGGLAIGSGIDMAKAVPWVVVSGVAVFLALLATIGIPASVRRLKWELVIKERGAGNWKLIEEADWEKFTRMIRLAEERKKREREELEKEMAKGPSWPKR